MNSIPSGTTRTLLRISSIIQKPSVHLCGRNTNNKELFLSRSPLLQGGIRSLSSSHEQDDSAEDKKKKAKAKLDDLLKSIVANKDAIKKGESATPIKHKLAVPKRKPPPSPKSTADTDAEAKIKKVAKKSKEIPFDEKQAVPPEVIVDPELSTAAQRLGTALKDPQIENELVQKLKTQQNGEKINISNLFKGMKIEKSHKPRDHQASERIDSQGIPSRAQRVRMELRDKGVTIDQLSVSESLRRQDPGRTHINIFGARPLGIFSPKMKTKSTRSLLETWDKLEKKEIQLALTHPPANGFQEMIMWTEQGKMWHFPIDNEQGIIEEAKVPFTDHVFLLPLVEPWCPSKGPIRHFMELVCTSLSKNPHLTVPEKREYLEWYHLYFKNKASIIREVGAGEIK